MKKRYNDGGLPDYETREDTPEEKAQFGAEVAAYKVSKGMNPNIDDDMTFKEAFAAARKEGDKKFKWRGKEYTTELAPSKPKEEKKSMAPARARAPAKASAKAGTAFKSGGSVSSASKRGDGCAIKGKTRGKMV